MVQFILFILFAKGLAYVILFRIFLSPRSSLDHPSWVTTHHWIIWTGDHQSYSVLQWHMWDPTPIWPSTWSIERLDRHTFGWLVNRWILQDLHLCSDYLPMKRSLKLWFTYLKYICKYHCCVFFWLCSIGSGICFLLI